MPAVRLVRDFAGRFALCGGLALSPSSFPLPPSTLVTISTKLISITTTLEAKRTIFYTQLTTLDEHQEKPAAVKVRRDFLRTFE